MITFYGIYDLMKALLFRAIVFFPFEFLGFFNVLPLFHHSKGPHKRIAFQAYNPQVAQVFLPIIRELRNNPDVDIWFTIMFHPYHGVRGLTDTRRFARDILGIPPNRIVMIWEAFRLPLDVLVCSDVYAKFPIKKTRTVLIPHGAGLLSRWVTKSLLRKTVSDFDEYLLCGTFDRDQVKPWVFHKPRLAETGFPFVDDLATAHTPRAARGGRPQVLYAPGWGHTYAYGDILSRNIREVMTCLKGKDVHIVLKLHAASFVRAQAKGIDWKKKLDAYGDGEDVTVVDDLNDIPWFKTADILISDISSRSFNFMITDRPVILYGIPDSFEETPIEAMRLKKLSEGAYRAKTPAELSAAIDHGLQYPAAMSARRRQVVADVFSYPGMAAQQTVNTLLHFMETT